MAGNLVNYDGVTRTYNATNQMTNDGSNNLTYDNNGNLKNDGTNAYTWDRANRLLRVGNHSYVYDGLSNRIQQTVNTVVTDYLNDVQPGLTKLLAQSTGANTEHFVHGVRGIHAVDDGTDWNFYAQDGLGSVRAVVDDAGVVQDSMEYDPYGNPMAAYGEGFGFTGEQMDANGSLFLRARYYEPEKGAWISRDFIGTPNRYAYVSGNPVNRVDPTGLLDWCTGEVGDNDTLNVIYGAAVGLGYIQPPHLHLEEVMRLLGEANVGNYPFYQAGISETGIAFNAGQNLKANGVTYINIPEQVRQAAGISCATPTLPEIPCSPPQLQCPDWYTLRNGKCYPRIPECPSGHTPRWDENYDGPYEGGYVCVCNTYGCNGTNPTETDAPNSDDVCSIFFYRLDAEARQQITTPEQLLNNPNSMPLYLQELYATCESDIFNDLYTVRPCLRDLAVARSAGLDLASILTAGEARAIGLAISGLGLLNTTVDPNSDIRSIESGGIGLIASALELTPLGIINSLYSLNRTLTDNCGVEERAR